MPTLYLLTPGIQAGLHHERLRVLTPPLEETEPSVREVHLHDVDLVIASQAVHLSFQALAELLHREIPLVLVGRGHGILGTCSPRAPHNLARLAHYRRMQDRMWTLALGATLVEAKIANSRRVLQRLAANREGAVIDPVLTQLEAARRQALQAGELDTLRGHEGAAAGAYYAAYGAFFPDGVPFERRSRRPPHNAANALLSFAYTLLAGETEAHCLGLGLDTGAGFLHEPEEGRPSLALDLIEPFRAPVADALAIDLLSHGTLKPREHFEPREGGIYLNREGRHKFFMAYERRMEREFTSEAHGQRTSLRREIDRQARSLRAALLGNEAFEPFVMN